MFSWTDISDHKGGVLLLSCILLAQSGVRWSARRAGVIVGGPKRLYALSTAMATAVMTPWALYHHEDLVSSHYSIHRGYFCFNVSVRALLNCSDDLTSRKFRTCWDCSCRLIIFHCAFTVLTMRAASLGWMVSCSVRCWHRSMQRGTGTSKVMESTGYLN